MRLAMAGALELRVEPPAAIGVTERPCASALVRAQLAQGRHDVTSLRHYHVNLGDEMARSLVSLLDGSRNHAELAAALAQQASEADPPELLAEKLSVSLRMMARLSLLAG